MNRPVYSQSDYRNALKRANTAREKMNELVESQVLHTLGVLLRDGDHRSADDLASHFLNHAPENRKRVRALALLRLTGESH